MDQRAALPLASMQETPASFLFCNIDPSSLKMVHFEGCHVLALVPTCEDGGGQGWQLPSGTSYPLGQGWRTF